MPPFPFILKIQVYNASGELVRLVTESYASKMNTGVTLLVDGVESDVVADGKSLEILMAGTEIPSTVGAGATSFFWATDTDGAQAASGGVYFIKFEQTDSYGHTLSIFKSVTVMRSEEYVELSVFNSAGETVKVIKAQNLSPDKPDLNVNEVTLIDENFTGIDMEYAPGYYVTWDGKTNNGLNVGTGTYEIQMISWTKKHGTVQSNKTIMIIVKGKTGLVEDLKILPNPYKGVEAGNPDHIRFTWTASGTGKAVVRVYDITGALVVKLDEKLETGFVDWQLYTAGIGYSVTGGIYLVVIEAKGSDGSIERKKQRLAITIKNI
jgi:hypothetical protein